MDSKRAITIGVLTGIIGALLIWYYVFTIEAQFIEKKEYVNVYIAAKDMVSGTQIQEELIKKIKIPKAYIQPGAVQNINDLIGKVVIAPIKRKEQILTTKLIHKGTATGAAVSLHQGERAFTLKTSGVNTSLILPGSFIDVVSVFKVTEGDNEIVKSQYLLNNVRVLAVGTTMTSFQRRRGKGQGGQVTVALKTGDVQKLAVAESLGKIFIVLRPRGDREAVTTEAVTAHEVLKLPENKKVTFTRWKTVEEEEEW